MDIRSNAVPVLTIYCGTNPAMQIQFGPEEPEEDAAGFGFYPVLWLPGTSQPLFPSAMEMKMEMMAILRQSPMPTAVRSSKDIASAVKANPWELREKQLSLIWPMPHDPFPAQGK